MKKKQAIFTILACSIAVVLLTGVLAVGLHSDGFGLKKLKRQNGYPVEKADGKYRYEYTWSLEESDVVGLDVEWVNGMVDIKVGGDTEIRITETSTKELANDEKLKLSSSGGVLKIKWEDNIVNFSLFQNRYKDLEIVVPKVVAEAMEELSCATTSGDVTLAGFTAEEVKLGSASGSLVLAQLQGETGEISTASGAVFLDGGSFSKKLDVSTASGDVVLQEVAGKKMTLHSVSGKLDLTGAVEELESSTVSGRCRWDLTGCPKKAEVSSVSGDMALSIPDNDGFEVEFASVSGSFSSDFPLDGGSGKSGRALYGSGRSALSFSTTSGRMEILRS